MKRPKRVWKENFYVHNDIVVDPPLDIKPGVVEIQLQETDARVKVWVSEVSEYASVFEVRGGFLDATVWYTYYFHIWKKPGNHECRIRFSPYPSIPGYTAAKEYIRQIEADIQYESLEKKLDIPLEEKQRMVDSIKNRIEEYRENRSLLYEDLENMQKLPEMDSNRRESFSDGCYDPDAEGYDLYAKTPVEQSIRLLELFCGMDSNTCSILEGQNIIRIGDLLRVAWTGGIFHLHVGFREECEKYLEYVKKLGIPTDWIVEKWHISK